MTRRRWIEPVRSRMKPVVNWRLGISQWLVCTPVIVIQSVPSNPSFPAIGGTIGTGIFLSAGIVRRSSSLLYCYMKLTYITSRQYRQAVLQVHFSLIVFSAYSFTVLWFLCKLILLWLDSALATHGIWLILSGEMSSMYPVSGAFSTFGTRFVSPALGFTLGEFKLRLLFE